MSKQPNWTSPARQAYLIKLWTLYGNQCLLGHTTCPIPEHYIHTERKQVLVGTDRLLACVDTNGNPVKNEAGKQIYITVHPIERAIQETETLCRLYDLKSEAIIKDWIADTRQQKQSEWLAELKAIHKTNNRTYPLHGKFSGVSRDIYHDSQPIFYLDSIGMSGLNFKPFARLRIASQQVILHVTLESELKPLNKSKNKKRKAIRYGKIPKDIQERIYNTCWQAVKTYLKY